MKIFAINFAKLRWGNANRRPKRSIHAGVRVMPVPKRREPQSGLTEDLTEFDVVLDEEDLAKLQERSHCGVIGEYLALTQRAKNFNFGIFLVSWCLGG